MPINIHSVLQNANRPNPIGWCEDDMILCPNLCWVGYSHPEQQLMWERALGMRGCWQIIFFPLLWSEALWDKVPTPEYNRWPCGKCSCTLVEWTHHTVEYNAIKRSHTALWHLTSGHPRRDWPNGPHDDLSIHCTWWSAPHLTAIPTQLSVVTAEWAEELFLDQDNKVKQWTSIAVHKLFFNF